MWASWRWLGTSHHSERFWIIVSSYTGKVTMWEWTVNRCSRIDVPALWSKRRISLTFACSVTQTEADLARPNQTLSLINEPRSEVVTLCSYAVITIMMITAITNIRGFAAAQHLNIVLLLRGNNRAQSWYSVSSSMKVTN